MTIVEVRLEALRLARELAPQYADYKASLAAIFSLAANIEAALLGASGLLVCVDGLDDLFDELQLVSAVSAENKRVSVGDLPVGDGDGTGQGPNEAFLGIDVEYLQVPVAGVSTTTVADGEGSVTAPSPGCAA
ncbi:hypothetical protein HN018_06725 [Lichenicola cladoniae]|uniref:Uncharacterized protein n=1 Tax=Lichenicola cladoniae TaxID=1484109 RepID=A0A6M8HN89_9PROT|nr:hypothetical protein [Lichenicola cladoniae]NPD67266.1 hypothetical protein [Acetobacteraceae bacterium]QKE89771.1 hypothetical protein HN018_06725 [Lichenicola cladoniae]